MNQKKIWSSHMGFTDFVCWQAARPALDIFETIERFNRGLNGAWFGSYRRRQLRRVRPLVQMRLVLLVLLAVLQACFLAAFWGTAAADGALAGFFAGGLTYFVGLLLVCTAVDLMTGTFWA